MRVEAANRNSRALEKREPWSPDEWNSPEYLHAGTDGGMRPLARRANKSGFLGKWPGYPTQVGCGTWRAAGSRRAGAALAGREHEFAARGACALERLRRAMSCGIGD